MTVNSTHRVFMIRPANFGYNQETAKSNFFQKDAAVISNVSAVAEFDQMVAGLRAAGVEVTVFQDHITPVMPDAVFPNNWISAQPGGSLFVYPMWAANRRIEKRQDIIDGLLSEGRQLIDFSAGEKEGLFLEGTGSMVLDHIDRKIYACLSPRTAGQLIDNFAAVVGYEAVVFEAVDQNGEAIYHTNVLMAVGTKFSLICMEAVVASQRLRLSSSLRSNRRKLIDISFEQMNSFAGNMLELQGKDGPLIVMSSSAYMSLRQDQRDELSAFGQLLHFPIPTIEHSGGSVRCMIAELYS